MKNRFYFLFTLAAAALIWTAASHNDRSSGAPVGATGAPSEHTCGTIGCHIGNDNVNTGPGSLSIEFPNQDLVYLPGQTYSITVKMEQTGIERFGFSFTALDNAGNRAGKLGVTDEPRTQIFNGVLQWENREYMTYRYIGTEPFAPGLGEWTFNWTAPETPVGQVEFYVGAVAADNDGTDLGDMVYTTSLALDHRLSSTPEDKNPSFSLSAHWNESAQSLHVKIGHAPAGKINFQLFDLSGKQVCSSEENLSGGSAALISPCNRSLEKGVYLLIAQAGTERISTKVAVF